MQETVGDRLLRLRLALGEENPEFVGRGGQSAFSRFLEENVTTWNNVETGGYNLSKRLADKICQRVPGIRHEWLWFGEDERLSPRLRQLLDRCPFSSTAASGRDIAGVE